MFTGCIKIANRSVMVRQLQAIGRNCAGSTDLNAVATYRGCGSCRTRFPSRNQNIMVRDSLAISSSFSAS
jgi:hypothetical protein